MHYMSDLLRALVWQPRIHYQVLRELALVVVRNRRLLLEMTKREITDRFAGSYLGVAWSVLHPLLLMSVYVVVFNYIFGRNALPNNEYGLDFTVHMMSAYLPWMVFSQTLVGGCSAVLGRANLVKQVVFPLEVLPLRGVLAGLLPQFVGTLFLLVYTLIRFGTLPWTWVLWPLLLVCELMVLSGIAFMVSAVGVYIRDLREVASVMVTILFYMSPIIYSEATAPAEWIKVVILFNPVSYLVSPFRDACFHGHLAHPAMWAVLPIGSVMVLVFGYRVFRKLKPQFGNAL